ncbi:MAG: amylo-alpha-1,6-glucosidase [Chitinophagales bacterium]
MSGEWTLGREVLADLDKCLRREWLVTNGIGGFAASTVVGANTRRYHGLLVAALRPPTERMLVLAKVEEEVSAGATRYLLSTNLYSGAVHPEGYLNLVEFRLDPYPTWIYDLGGRRLERTLHLVHGRNACVLRYRYLSGSDPLRLELYPLVNARDYHHLVSASFGWDFHPVPGKGWVALRAYAGAPTLRLAAWAYRAGQGAFSWALDQGVPGTPEPAVYSPTGHWYYRFRYPVEKERGLDFEEDHYNPGMFALNLGPGETAAFSAEVLTGLADGADPGLIPLRLSSRKEEAERLEQVEQAAGFQHPLLRTLARAADQFIVHRESTGTATVIAGYPWFTDWGRDTFISLPGLTLVNGRFGVAREILATFARYVKDGLVPNRFPDRGEEAEYNSADASLWFIHAAHRYLHYTGDAPFVLGELLPVITGIIAAYREGTRFGIRQEADGLIFAHEEGLALTWMDARVDGQAVTPRSGKPVELNALWYNALRSAAHLAGLAEQGPLAAIYQSMAGATKDSFLRRFWYEEGGYLFDVVDATYGLPNPVRQEGTDRPADPALRPNQLLALSLPYPVVDDPAKARRILARVKKELLTPVGLRTLCPRHPAYRGRYGGNPAERDAAYHQGTVWPWLLGPYLTAFLRFGGDRAEALALALGMAGQLGQVCLGGLPEIYAGDPPHEPGGCFAQAWSVAELLRAAVEDLRLT